MARPTKDTQRVRRLTRLIHGEIEKQGLSDVPMKKLLEFAVTLIICNKGINEKLLDAIIDEIANRVGDVVDIESEYLLASLVKLSSKGIEEKVEAEKSLAEFVEEGQLQQLKTQRV